MQFGLDLFDTSSGHDHDGIDSKKISGINVDGTGRYDGTTVFLGIAPTSFTDLNLSPYVGRNRALVFLKVKPTGGNSELQFRTKGDTEEIGNVNGGTYLGGGCSAATVSQNRIAYILVMTDDWGTIEWQGFAVSTTIILLGYIKLN